MADDNQRNEESGVDFTSLDEILKEIGEEGVPQKDKKYIYKPWDQDKNKTQYSLSGADVEEETTEIEEEQPEETSETGEDTIKVEGEEEETETEEEQELPEGHFEKPIEMDEEDKVVNEIFSVLDDRINWKEVRQVDEKERELTEEEGEEEAIIKDENIPELEFKRPKIDKMVSDRYNDDYTPKEDTSVYEKYSDILGDIEGIETGETETEGKSEEMPEEETEQPEEEFDFEEEGEEETEEDQTEDIEVVSDKDLEEMEEEKEEGETEEEGEEEAFSISDEDILGEEDTEDSEDIFSSDIEEDITPEEFDTLGTEEEDEEETEDEQPEEREEVTEIDTGDANIFGSTEDILSSTEEEIEGGEEMPEDEQPEEEFDFEEEGEAEEEEQPVSEFDFEEPELEEEETEAETFTDSDGMETLSDEADVADLFGEGEPEDVMEGTEEEEGEPTDEFGFPEMEEEGEEETEELEDFSLSTDTLEGGGTSEDIFDGSHYEEEGGEDLSRELDENIPVSTEEEEGYEEEYEEETQPVETVKETSESIELSEEEFEHIKRRLDDLPEPTASEARDVIINEKLNKQDMRTLINLLVQERPYPEVQNFLDKKLGKKKPSLPAGVYILITILLVGVIVYLVLMIAGINPIQTLQAHAEGQSMINKGVEILNTESGEEAVQEAEDLFKGAIEKNPNNVDYYNKYADVYLRRNEPQKALEKLIGDRKPIPVGD